MKRCPRPEPTQQTAVAYELLQEAIDAVFAALDSNGDGFVDVFETARTTQADYDGEGVPEAGASRIQFLMDRSTMPPKRLL